MFNNLVNIHDFYTLLERLRKRQFGLIFSRLAGSEKRTKKAWQSTERTIEWCDIPAVKKRRNYLITGDADVEYYEYVSRKYLSDRRPLRALSLGCGTGARELIWAGSRKFKSIDAYDLSEKRIELARKRAEEKGYGEVIEYHAANVYHIEMTDGSYDVVLAEQSLHHLSPLAEILQRLNRSLKPDGCFIVNEFVGPIRFQWTDRQLEVINGLLSILPERYKVRRSDGSIKSRVFRPSRLRCILYDPSEAVESAEIMPLLHKIFNVVEVKNWGGTVLHMLFHDIADNFMSEDEETQHFLKLCFEAEDLLLQCGDIESDFVFAVCKKRNT